MATREAPRYLVPDVYICSVEHPGVIESRDRACASLGGKGAIQEVLYHQQTADIVYSEAG